MYKFFIIATAALIACSQALPNAYDAAAETRSFKSDLKEDGSYTYQYDTSNGIAAQESGVGGYYASGSSAYYSPEGQLIQLTYTADENGFHPSGEHLPTPPPIPAAILKALEYIRTHPNQEERQGGGAQQQNVQHQYKVQQQRYRPSKF
ncbi:pupal cuticle protein Edg-78E-like [Teleopsis dalmanni]|uniref:pupal cuticle protein Edg-78E-like n=1 Tax=Teleopsis dalmanni TaxID=139649 RepID=UPI000D32C2A0|nr:pupal cuticle protein Edg-78E-like [Teleopsis dalmanni]XP_037939385.1 pupal cuticle protein Edg-78E-like [Teleopsis dalmanni]XP_037939665.1 pupal cuticle protein Edg-78E-like [Teleopsis dalmanni]